MKENVKKFLQAASKDETLQKELKEADNFEAMQKIAAAKGFTFTENDFQDSGKEIAEISEDEMKAVAGGRISSPYSCSCSGPTGVGDGWNLYCYCFLPGNGNNMTNNSSCCDCTGGNGLGAA